MNGIVYLAGPISGLSFAGCTIWRDYAAKTLNERGIRAMSPLRGKEYLAALESISGHGNEYAHMGVLSTSRGVMTRDRFDATRCDVLLVNLLGATAVSIGTVMEIAWADDNRTPIVCAMEDTGNPHEHMMINEALGFRVPTLDEALHVTTAILTERVHR